MALHQHLNTGIIVSDEVVRVQYGWGPHPCTGEEPTAAPPDGMEAAGPWVAQPVGLWGGDAGRHPWARPLRLTEQELATRERNAERAARLASLVTLHGQHRVAVGVDGAGLHTFGDRVLMDGALRSRLSWAALKVTVPRLVVGPQPRARVAHCWAGGDKCVCGAVRIGEEPRWSDLPLSATCLPSAQSEVDAARGASAATARRASGLSEKDAADRLGLTVLALALRECGYRRIEVGDERLMEAVYGRAVTPPRPLAGLAGESQAVRLKQARVNAGLTLKQAADALGISADETGLLRMDGLVHHEYAPPAQANGLESLLGFRTQPTPPIDGMADIYGCEVADLQPLAAPEGGAGANIADGGADATAKMEIR